MDKKDLADMSKAEQKKTVKEILTSPIPSVGEWMDEQMDKIARFVGDEIDPKKQEQLDNLQKFCRLLADENEGVSVPFFPRTKKDRHATVILRLAYPFAPDGWRAARILANIFALADSAAINPIYPISLPDEDRAPDDDFNDGIRDGVMIVLTVNDLWAKWHRED